MNHRPPNLEITQPAHVRRVSIGPRQRVNAGYAAPPYAPRQPVPAPPPAAQPNGQARPHLPARPRARRVLRWWMVAAAAILLMLSVCGALTLGVGLVYAGGILPGVSAAGIDLGGLSAEQAAAKLQARWNAIVLQDGSREWPVDPTLLGIQLDAARTAQAAYQQGRGSGSIVKALLGKIEITPVVSIDFDMLRAALSDLAPHFEVAPVNAGVKLVDGRVETTPPVDGRMLDLDGTLARLQQNPAALASGRVQLAMFSVQPNVTDASPMVAEAERLLSSFLDIRVYDPGTGDSVYWSLPPQQWAAWLTAAPDSSRPSGLSLAVDPGPVSNYLTAQAVATFDPSRYIKVDEGVASVQQAVVQGRTDAFLRVYHHDTQHVVQPGETIISIAWDYGVPYPWIQAANQGSDTLSAGQTITIPSIDNFLPFPPIPDKRIVVSISRQRMWAYENGTVKWEWPVSTGINSSPTWPGIYQILSHEINAYAGNWNLWMPHFLGVYRPIPGSDFTNGFHGFPTRGGGQLLWENSLGTRVTYGCILISNTNAQQLYDWAREGVVVEIQP